VVVPFHYGWISAVKHKSLGHQLIVDRFRCGIPFALQMAAFRKKDGTADSCKFEKGAVL